MEDDKKFYENQMEKARLENKMIKDELSVQSTAYDQSYQIAQVAMEQNKETSKIEDIIGLF